MKAFVSGWNNITQRTFDIRVDPKLIIKLMDLTDEGRDSLVDKIIHNMELATDKDTAKVLDSFTWIDFAEEAREMLREGHRFAIRSNEVEFGISGKSHSDARMSLAKEEF